MITWTGFALGFLGSLHCLGMCGPLAIALPRAGEGIGYFVGRVVYNLGRVITYSLMGVLFGLIGKSFVLAGFQQWLSIALGVVILVLVFLGPRFAAKLSLMAPVLKAVTALKTALGAVLKKRSIPAMLAIGLLNGLLPCGLVYIALAGAAVTGSAAGGALYMALFGLGTIPMMLAVSLSGGWVQQRFRFNLRRAIPIALVCLASLFILRGLSLGIPYISPDLSAGGSCCH